MHGLVYVTCVRGKDNKRLWFQDTFSYLILMQLSHFSQEAFVQKCVLDKWIIKL